MRFALIWRRRDERPWRLYAFLHVDGTLTATRRQPAAIQVEHQMGPQRTPLEPLSVESLLGNVSLLNKRTCVLVEQETCILVEQEYMCSCWTRTHKKTCVLVEQEDMCSCWTRKQSERHLGGIWEASGRHLRGWRLGRHLGGIWRADLRIVDSLSNRM